MKRTAWKIVCLLLVAIGTLSGCSMKSEIRKQKPNKEEKSKEVNLSDIKEDIKDEYSMFTVSYMDIDDMTVVSGILGEDVERSKVEKQVEDNGESVSCEYKVKDMKCSWLCELVNGQKRYLNFSFDRKGKKLKIENADKFIRNILKKIGCRYPVSDSRIVEKDGKSVQLEYDFIYKDTELTGNRGITFEENELTRVAHPSYIDMNLNDGVIESLGFANIPDKIHEVKKCHRKEFISLEDVANITDRAPAYPSATNIEKVEIVYTSLPQNDNFTFSPLYQVKFKTAKEEEVCNWKDRLLIDVFTGRTYR